MTAKYAAPQRLLHWLMAVLIFGLLGLGYFMTRYITPDTDLQVTVYYIHISIAVIVLALLAMRIVARISNGAPALPDAISPRAQAWAHWGHMAMYGLISAVILSGWFNTAAQGYPVKVFGIELPAIFSKRETFLGQPVDPFLSQIHMFLAYTLGALIVGHVYAVIRHVRKDGVNLLTRMR